VAITVKPPPASPVQVMRFFSPRAVSNSTNVSVPFVNARTPMFRRPSRSSASADAAKMKGPGL